MMPDLAAAVPFYGSNPEPAEASKVKASLLVHMAESDKGINGRWPEYAAALKQANVPHESYIYPGTQHGFNNDTTPRYDEAAAKLAWQRTKHLRYARGAAAGQKRHSAAAPPAAPVRLRRRQERGP